MENGQLFQPTAEHIHVYVLCVFLTAVLMEDVGEAVQDAVTTATVGASSLNPLSVRTGPTVPTDTETNMTVSTRETITASVRERFI